MLVQGKDVLQILEENINGATALTNSEGVSLMAYILYQSDIPVHVSLDK